MCGPAIPGHSSPDTAAQPARRVLRRKPQAATGFHTEASHVRYATLLRAAPVGPPRGAEAAERRSSARGAGGGVCMVLLAAAVAVPLAVMAQAAPALAANSPPGRTYRVPVASNVTANGRSILPRAARCRSRPWQAPRPSNSRRWWPAPRTRTSIAAQSRCGYPHRPRQVVRRSRPCRSTTAWRATPPTAGTMEYTDVTSGVTVSEPVTWTGPCCWPGTTTTTLSIPSGSWTPVGAATNPAYVNVGIDCGSHPGRSRSRWTGSPTARTPWQAGTGCTLADLPVGSYEINASYSGSSIPIYESSSASVALTVTVDQVQPTEQAAPSNWSGYVATGGNCTAASASWTVPVANCLSPSFQAATELRHLGGDRRVGRQHRRADRHRLQLPGGQPPRTGRGGRCIPISPRSSAAFTSSYPVFGGGLDERHHHLHRHPGDLPADDH